MRYVLCAPPFSVVSREKDFTCCGGFAGCILSFWIEIHDTHPLPGVFIDVGVGVANCECYT
jgi:hypothetical protein